MGTRAAGPSVGQGGQEWRLTLPSSGHTTAGRDCSLRHHLRRRCVPLTSIVRPKESSLNRISLKAVVLSFLAVLVFDTVVGDALLALSSGEIFVDGRSDEQVSEALLAATTSTSFLLASVVLGTLTTIAGGYVVARMARQFPYFNGLVLGILGALFGLAFWSEHPLWFNLVCLAVVIPTTLLGAHIAVRRGVTRA